MCVCVWKGGGGGYAIGIIMTHCVRKSICLTRTHVTICHWNLNSTSAGNFAKAQLLKTYLAQSRYYMLFLKHSLTLVSFLMMTTWTYLVISWSELIIQWRYMYVL